MPGLKPAALIARHWATIAARRSFSLVPKRPSFAAHARWRPAASGSYTRAAPPARGPASRGRQAHQRAPPLIRQRQRRNAPSMSANLFDLMLERAPRRDKLAIDAPDGLSLSYAELFARAGRAARALVDCGVEPGDRVAAADRQVARRDRAGARLLQGGGGAAAAQPRLYARRARIFSRRRRAGADDLPPGSARRRARARRQARPQGGRKPRDEARRELRRADRRGGGGIADGRARAPTISPRSSTPRAPPGARRARC